MLRPTQVKKVPTKTEDNTAIERNQIGQMNNSSFDRFATINKTFIIRKRDRSLPSGSGHNVRSKELRRSRIPVLKRNI